MRILAFAGSNSTNSINLKLVKHVISFFGNDTITLLNLNSYEMPVFSIDREKNNGFPQLAHDFLQEITNCNAVILSLAEHNRVYTTAFKNILDWCSRIQPRLFQEKPMLLMSTSPGSYGGGNVLEHATKFFPQFGAQIITTFKLPKFNDNFDNNRGVTNKELKQELADKIVQFKKHFEGDNS